MNIDEKFIDSKRNKRKRKKDKKKLNTKTKKLRQNSLLLKMQETVKRIEEEFSAQNQ